MRLAGALLALLLSGTALASDADVPPPPGYQPDQSGTEGGLWMMVDRAEQQVKTSPLLVRDEALNAYMRKLVCDLAGPHCASVRIYILNTPEFNASAAPNGMLQIYTGLLLRAENEAQLVFVLGHEITHFLKRHTLKQFESARDTADVLAFFSLAAAGAGVGIAGSLASLIAAGAIASYTRSQETEADNGGFDLVVKMGYDPRAGATVWSRMEAEQAANPHRRSRAFFASHPTNKDRLAELTKRANEIEATAQTTELGRDRFRAVIAPYRAAWLQEELDRGEYHESMYLIGQLLAADPNSGELHFFLGECYRRRNAKGDAETALASYAAAIAAGGAPAAVHRSVGIVNMKAGNAAVARDAFQRYLAVAPKADDRAMIESYIAQL